MSENRFSTKIAKLLAIIFWLSLWQFAHTYVGEVILLPSPLNVIKKLYTMLFESQFWSAVMGSLARITIGFISACIVGIIISILAYRFKLIKILIEPLMMIIKAIPVVSFVILALVWINSKNISVFISFLMVVPIIYTNVLKGLETMDKELLEMAAIFKVSNIKKALYIYIPSVMPFFVSGISIGIGFCWKSGIAAEVIGLPSNSIGENLYNAKIFLDTTSLFAWTAAMIIISIIYEKVIIKLIESVSHRIERL